MKDIDDILGPALNADLHHYTGISGLYGIARSRQVWASSAYYLNDSSEIISAVRLTQSVAEKMSQQVDDEQRLLLEQFVDWLNTLKSPQGLYVFSLSEKENDLSQWRAYTPYAKGVCLSFAADQMMGIAEKNSCRIIRCQYSEVIKGELATRVVEKTVETWSDSPEFDTQKAHPSQKYHPLFEGLKENYLTAFASFKDQRFEGEGEWRIVSQHMPSLDERRIDYRLGASILIPYMMLSLPEQGPLFDRIWIGPTEHNNLSMHAISAFMSKYSLTKSGCVSSGIPYREWR